MADKAVSKFKKPAWLVKKQAEALTQPANALPDSTKTRDAISVFYRSADTEAIIGIEKERKERRRKEKKQQQERERRERAAEHQRKSIEAWTEETDRLSREPESKRRRISTENEDGPTYTRTSKSRSGSPSCQIVDKPPVFVPMHIVIEDSDDEVAKHTPPRSRKEKDRLRPVTKSPARPRQAIIILSDDEDTPAIQAQQTRVASPEVDVLEPSDDDGPDPVMTIFIVPEMPNTEPLLVHRRYKQKLKDVRKAWCRHNNLRPSQEAECIFVWNNKRIYDVQSCQDIGILVEDDGAPYVLTADGLHESLENIALAATTRAIWEEEKLESQKRARAAEIELEGRSPEPTKEPEYKVILKSKNHNDVKLKMKRETTMQKLVDIFRSRNEVPVESQISVVYDGEELEPDLQVKDAEFMEDYEEGEVLNLEIHIK